MRREGRQAVRRLLAELVGRVDDDLARQRRGVGGDGLVHGAAGNGKQHHLAGRDGLANRGQRGRRSQRAHLRLRFRVVGAARAKRHLVPGPRPLPANGAADIAATQDCNVRLM